MLRRVALRGALVAAVAWSLLQAPAGAHTVTGVTPSNYDSELLFIRPALSGVRVRVLDLGRRIELTNTNKREVQVLGYSGEPYLRVGPSGVFENRRAPTTYLNRPPTVTGAQPKVPASADANAPPEWRRVSTSARARWRDRRTRVESATNHPSSRTVVSSWTIELQRDATRAAAVGRITYVPPPQPWPWIVALVALLALTTAAAWSRQWGRWLSVALALLLASDMVQSFGTAAATHDAIAAQLGRVFLAGLVTTLAWLAGLLAVPALQRNHEGGLVAAGAVGLVIAGFSGVTDLGALTHSQVASVFPAVIGRIAVVFAVGFGVGLVAAAAAVIARDPSLRPTVVAHSGDTNPSARSAGDQG